VDEKIAEGVDKPFDLLSDPNNNDRRAEKRAKNPVESGRGKNKKQKIVSLSHPHLKTLNILKEQLNDGSLTETTEE